MGSFKINGGIKLKGELVPQGAKNEALQVLSAVLLSSDEIEIHNIPEIADVNKLIELLKDLGVKIEKLKTKGSLRFKADEIDLNYLNSKEFRKKGGSLRGSIMIIGPLLTRFGKGYIPSPGGDKIGRRRLDTHFTGFEKLGAKFEFLKDENFYKVKSGKLKGNYILLEEASVTGTANLIMAACLADGKTTLYNAACEPYIQQLCKMLNNMGAKISGVGSNLITVEGVEKLNGCSHTLLPDMIEIGSFMALAALTESEITIKGAGVEHLGIIPLTFEKLGMSFLIKDDNIFIPSQKHYEIESFIDGSMLTIADAPWPGLTPDLLSVILVMATQAKGNVLIHQKMFESRLFFVDNLIDMGAQIILCDPHRATVMGLNRRVPLRGIKMTSPDIRAGVSLLIAALSAQGTSIINNIEQIDRGYQNIEHRLNALGADIERIQ
ncbi:MAG: UDP-N-acetylglucosamine 1-carboxyvinyltransferase [Bacteroidetes bacterium]|nr:UDP-N-acetylglucosamine 1-carboxyvinyltransferase [Bacteroidota bacterium]